MPTASAIAAWLTVGGGLLLLALWLAAGGSRAVEPGAGPQLRDGPRSRFRLAHVAAHGTLGVLVAVLLSVLAAGGFSAEVRSAGVTIGILAIVVVLGLGLVRLWKRGRAEGEDAPEQRLPTTVVAVHGLAAASTAVLAVGGLIEVMG
jgi:hypothetical protein